MLVIDNWTFRKICINTTNGSSGKFFYVLMFVMYMQYRKYNIYRLPTEIVD